MRIPVRYLVLALILTVTGVYFFGYINGHKKTDRVSQTLLHAKDSTLNVYSTKINGLEVKVAEKEQEVLSQREALKADAIYREELRKLNLKQANELTRLNFRIDTLLEDVDHTGHIDTVYVDNKPVPCITLPFEFKKVDEYLSLTGSFNSQAKLDIDLKMNIGVDVWTGIDKVTKNPVVKITTPNKYINAINISSYKFDTPKERKYNLSLFAGYGIGRDLKTTPFVGIGLGRTIFRF